MSSAFVLIVHRERQSTNVMFIEKWRYRSFFVSWMAMFADENFDFFNFNSVKLN